MTDLDKMARELLAAELARDGWAGELAAVLLADRPDDARVSGDMTLAAIRAALLTAPPGWKLVPELADDAMLSAGFPRNEIIDGCFDRQGAWADMLAAAPEVK